MEVAKDLKSTFRDAPFSDVTFLVGPDPGTPIKAHRYVLVSRSAYFRAMFSNGFEESNTQVVHRPNTNPEIFMSFLEWVYTASVELTQSNVTELLLLADELDMPSLKSYCASYIKSSVNGDNMLSYLEFSLLHHALELIDACKEVFAKQSKRVLESDALLHCSEEALMEILKTEEIKVPELDMFMTVERWVKHDRANREPSLPRLLEHVRFMLIKRDDIVKFVEPSGIVPPDTLIQIYRCGFAPALLQQLREEKHKWVTPRSKQVFTWESSVAGALFTIKDNGATIVRNHPGSGNNTCAPVRCTQPITPDNNSICFRITDLGENNYNQDFGVSFSETMPLEWIGSNPTWWGVHHHQSSFCKKAPNKATEAYGFEYRLGDVLKMQADFDSGKFVSLSFYINGKPLGVAFSSVPADKPLYPWISLSQTNQCVTIVDEEK